MVNRILTFFIIHLERAETKHGFHTNTSTSFALLTLAHKVATCFNKPHPPHFHIAAMATDLSKAFDTVNYTKQMTAVCNSTNHRSIVRWLSSYLRGRHAFSRYNEATSTCHAVQAGVPQRSIITPTLFNFTFQFILITYYSIPHMPMIYTYHIQPGNQNRLQMRFLPMQSQSGTGQRRQVLQFQLQNHT